jgi:cytochrome c biogenesis protein CcdA
MIELALAFLAGLATIASPCILPMLPIIFGTAIGTQDRLRPLFIALGFVLSFASAALIFGAFVAELGVSQRIIRDIAAGSLVLFGLSMIWPDLLSPIMARLPQLSLATQASGESRGHIGALMIGASMGLLWTPCAGPILASVLALVAAAENLTWAAILLLAYGIGAGLPMLAVAYGGQVITTSIRRHMAATGHIRRFFGALVAIGALAIYLQLDSLAIAHISNWIGS